MGCNAGKEGRLQIGSARPQAENVTVDVRGIDQVSGLPKSVPVGTWEITEATADAVNAIVATARAVLEQTPPELASDVVDKGMILTGGGALLRNLDKLLTRETGVPAYVAEDRSEERRVGKE